MKKGPTNKRAAAQVHLLQLALDDAKSELARVNKKNDDLITVVQGYERRGSLTDADWLERIENLARVIQHLSGLVRELTRRG